MPNVRARYLAAAAAWGLRATLALGQEPAPPPAPAPAATSTPAPAASPKPAPPPDVYYLRNGDRITGRTLTQGKRSFAIQTPFGRLNVPRARVAKVVRADGSEEVFQPVDAAAASPPAVPVPAPAPPPAARLVVAITGKTFWQAWDARESGRDLTLRLELRLDEEPVVVYSDTEPDPDEIPGSLVNAFAFGDGLTVAPAPGVRVHPAEVRPGRIVLKLDLAAPGPAARRLRMAYQVNAGTAQEPAWRDVVSAATEVTLADGQPALVEAVQDRGRMEFAGFPRRRMRHVETFALSLEATTPAAPAP